MWTYRFAVLTAVATFTLLLIGGIVHGTGSSLACPDWPLCFGQFFPTMEGNVLVEHGHRLFASGVGILTVILTVLAFRYGRSEPSSAGRSRVRWLAAAALLIVIFQGVLGGLTVIYRLPTLISWAHLCTSMLFFSLVISLACLTRTSLSRATVAPRTYRLLLGTTALCYVQIALGGLVRHTGGGLACLDIPLCKGSLLPLGEHPTVIIHAVHRLNALGVAALVTALAVTLLRRPLPGMVRGLGAALFLLVLVQITLGVFSVWSFLDLFYVTAHLGVGALLLGSLVTLCWLLRAPAAAARSGVDSPLAASLAASTGGAA